MTTLTKPYRYEYTDLEKERVRRDIDNHICPECTDNVPLENPSAIFPDKGARYCPVCRIGWK